MKQRNWVIGIILIVLTVLLGFFTKQHEFKKIISFYSVFFLVYFIIFTEKNHSKKSLNYFIGLSVLLRLILVFAFPSLSNDVYRFIWDGRLLVQGFNPFDHLPMYYLENDTGVGGITKELFNAYDAKNFHTVYPPLAQAQFSSACWLFPDSEYWSAVVMKLWLFFFELGSIFLIIKLLDYFCFPKARVLIYALNPLIIFEITGNLHFEGAMIFFLLLAIYLLVLNKNILSALAFAMSICSKLLTLMFMPFFIKKLGWTESIKYYLIVGLACLFLFLPIISNQFIENFSESLNLYFQKLEFNASLYYVARWIGYLITGFNYISVIGPGLAILAGLMIIYLAFIKQSPKMEKEDWPEMIKLWLLAICVYLFCTTTLHPWYVAMPVALCVFTNYRFPILWSYLIFWTYINYSYTDYEENLWVVAIEYTLVFGWFIKEYLTNDEKILSL